MSEFATAIPVDVEGVKKLLPTGSFIEGVEWDKDKQEVVLRWSNHKLRTPYNIPTPFPVDILKAQELPKCVKLPEAQQPAVTVTSATSKDLTKMANDISAEFPDAAKAVSLAGQSDVTVTDNVKPVDTKPKRGVKKAQ